MGEPEWMVNRTVFNSTPAWVNADLNGASYTISAQPTTAISYTASALVK